LRAIGVSAPMYKLLVLIFLGINTLAAKENTDEIAKNIVLGEVFSSKNAYFIAFSKETKWEDSLHFHGLNSLSEILTAKKKNIILPCSENSYFLSKEKSKAKVSYFVGAFFSTIMDECVEEEVAQYYANQKIKEAYNIFGWAPTLDVKNISLKNNDQLRPVPQTEMAKMKAEKLQAAKDNKEDECTTEPQFVDSAKIFLEFDIGNKGLKGRLSGYFNPGCAGHLSDIYILDIFKGKDLIKSYQTFHYQGGI